VNDAGADRAAAIAILFASANHAIFFQALVDERQKPLLALIHVTSLAILHETGRSRCVGNDLQLRVKAMRATKIDSRTNGAEDWQHEKSEQDCDVAPPVLTEIDKLE
jgi:hypothetical protein